MTELIVEQFGAFVGRHSERIRVSQKGEILSEHPILTLDRVLIVGNGVSLSADAIRGCTESDIPITFVDPRGDLYAQVVSVSLMGTARTRREQIAAATDERGVHIARELVATKLHNQAALLKYLTKNHRADAARFDFVHTAVIAIEAASAAASRYTFSDAENPRPDLIALEAQGSRDYWSAFGELLREGVPWPGRHTHGATDLVTSMLNYGYAILLAEVERAIAHSGLDPFAGFLHADRPGRVSLALDLIEEFRQTVVDRCVIAILNRGRTVAAISGRLDQATLRLLAESILTRLETSERVGRRRARIRAIIHEQARKLAEYLRRERPAYRGFVAQW